MFAGCVTFASCLGDLDTLPLDDNELTGEMVYSTPEAISA